MLVVSPVGRYFDFNGMLAGPIREKPGVVSIHMALSLRWECAHICLIIFHDRRIRAMV